MSALLDAALGYAARGWPVFPCAPGTKVPAGHLVHRGVLDATTDPGRITAWWAALPEANVAIATGAPGPDVIDFDTADGQLDVGALGELNNSGVLYGHGGMVKTRSGGLHFYYAGTSQRNGSIRRRHVDFRSGGGYVLAPPSFVEANDKPAGHYTGSPVETRTGLDWAAIRALLDPPPDPAPFTQPARDTGLPAEGRPGDDWAARTSWDDFLLNHGWRKVRDLGNGRACWCRPGKTGSWTSATTREQGGLYVFSTSTEFEPEVPYSKFGALALLEHGGDHAAAARQLRADGYGSPLPAPVPGPQLAAAVPAQPGADDQAAPAEWWAEIAARHVPVDWQQLFDDTPEDEDWIIEPLLAAGWSIALYSPPKAGKSLITLEVTAALAAGRPVLGRPAGRPRTVLYVDLENSRRNLRDRLADLGYKPQDLGSLIYLSFPSLPVLDSAQGGREILGLAMAHRPDVVVIDTVSRVIGGKENDADTFNALYRYALSPLKAMGIAVMRLDHAGKDASKGMRGSSGKNGDVDAVWTLDAAGNAVTLRCEMSRTPIENTVISLRRERDPLRHELTADAAIPVNRAQALMARLDELGVPRGASNRECLQELRKAGARVNTNDLRVAVSARKAQFKLSDDLETNDLGDTPGNGLSQDHQTAADRNGIVAGQTLTQDHQTGETNGSAGVPGPACLSLTHPVGGVSARQGADAEDSQPPGIHACPRCFGPVPGPGELCPGCAGGEAS